MSLTSNNKGNEKGGPKAKNNMANSKFIMKPGKPAPMAKKPVKTGGMRGS